MAETMRTEGVTEWGIKYEGPDREGDIEFFIDENKSTFLTRKDLEEMLKLYDNS